MSEAKTQQLDLQQVVYLPRWARFSLMALLAALAISACATAAVILLSRDDLRDTIVPLMAIAQTAAGAFAVVVFVLFAEKQLSTPRLHSKTGEFLEVHIREALSRIELPQIHPDKTISVTVLKREKAVHGGRKDIYGANYELHLDSFRMQMWVGINVKRLSVIYFAKAQGAADTERLRDVFKYTFTGAESVGYRTNFEYAVVGEEHIVSMWSTVLAEQAILGNPAEQLFWVQDVAMMTQSLARTALRNGVSLSTKTAPSPL